MEGRPATVTTMMLRGLTCRCGRCGGRGVIRRWFRLRERCPTCGYRFKREEGFFTGVFLVNFGVTLAVMWLVIMVYIVWRAASDTDPGLLAMVIGCLAIAVLVPVVFYPVATTTWAAMDLAMRPLEPEEEADALTWVEAGRKG